MINDLKITDTGGGSFTIEWDSDILFGDLSSVFVEIGQVAIPPVGSSHSGSGSDNSPGTHCTVSVPSTLPHTAVPFFFKVVTQGTGPITEENQNGKYFGASGAATNIVQTDRGAGVARVIFDVTDPSFSNIKVHFGPTASYGDPASPQDSTRIAFFTFQSDFSPTIELFHFETEGGPEFSGDLIGLIDLPSTDNPSAFDSHGRRGIR